MSTLPPLGTAVPSKPATIVRRGSFSGLDSSSYSNLTGEHRVVERVLIRAPKESQSPTKEDIEEHKFKSYLKCVRFSPDSKMLAVAMSNSSISLYNAKDGKRYYTIRNTNSARFTKKLHLQDYSDEILANEEATKSTNLNTGGASTVNSAGQVILTPGKSKDYLAEAAADDPAIMSLRFLPQSKEDIHKSGAYSMLTCDSNGMIQHWDIYSKNDPEQEKEVGDDGTVVVDPDYEYDGVKCRSAFKIDNAADGFNKMAYNVEYDNTGYRFAAACSDAVVRIYDEESQKLIRKCDGGDGAAFSIDKDYMQISEMGYSMADRRNVNADDAMTIINKTGIRRTTDTLNVEQVSTGHRHSNRVFACKFYSSGTHIQNMLISGGWDSTIQCWDLRTNGPAVKSFYGAYICGDAIDIQGNTVVTGSHRYENQLQLWDIRFGKEPVNVEVIPGNLSFTAAFSKGDHKFFCAGGVGPTVDNELEIFDYTEKGKAAVLPDCRGGVVSLNWADVNYSITKSLKVVSDGGTGDGSRNSVKGGLLAIGCGSGDVKIVEICTTASQVFVDDAEFEVDNGEETDSDVHEDSMRTRYKEKLELIIDEMRRKRIARMAGEKIEALTSPGKIVLTPKISRKYDDEEAVALFGDDDDINGDTSPGGQVTFIGTTDGASSNGESSTGPSLSVSASLPALPEGVTLKGADAGMVVSQSVTSLPTLKINTGTESTELDQSGDSSSFIAPTNAQLMSGEGLSSPDLHALDGEIERFLEEAW